MELIAKISKGSKMDQIYLPKNRDGFGIGNYVIVRPVIAEEINLRKQRPYFYGIKSIEPIKLKIIWEIFSLIERENIYDKIENIIITGSFLDSGFKFNDIDILIITSNKFNIKEIENKIKINIGIKPHLIIIDNKSLLNGLSTDPIYQSMLSKCISKKRLIYKIKTGNNSINYKLLDLQLLKSKIVLDAFDFLTGNERYYYLHNLITISIFLKSRKVKKSNIEKEIKNLFGDKDIIKQGILDKKEFLSKYKKIYDETFNIIMRNIKKKLKTALT